MKIPDQARREIKEVIDKNGIEYKWLSEKTGYDYDVLWRQLNTAKHYREEIHQAVVNALTKAGYISSNDGQIEKLKDELIDSEAIINGAISLLNRSFREKTIDKKFDSNEKKEYKQQVKQLQNRINDALDTIIITIDMK